MENLWFIDGHFWLKKTHTFLTKKSYYINTKLVDLFINQPGEHKSNDLTWQEERVKQNAICLTRCMRHVKQIGVCLTCKIPKKGAIESSYFYFPAWIIWYSANFISFNHNSILILALRPYVIQGRNALVMKWVSHAELQSFNTMRVITRAHYYAFRRDFTV